MFNKDQHQGQKQMFLKQQLNLFCSGVCSRSERAIMTNKVRRDLLLDSKDQLWLSAVPHSHELFQVGWYQTEILFQ